MNVEKEVIEYRRKYKLRFRDKGMFFWYRMLLEEVVELGLALLGFHKHKPDFELKQISSIAINFIEHYREAIND